MSSTAQLEPLMIFMDAKIALAQLFSFIFSKTNEAKFIYLERLPESFSSPTHETAPAR